MFQDSNAGLNKTNLIQLGMDERSVNWGVLSMCNDESNGL